MIIVEIADKFKEALDAVEEFMLVQDVLSAPRRANKLEEEIVDLISLLERHPHVGRPADFLSVTSTAAKDWLERVLQLAVSVGLTEFREFVLAPYVVLYACSESRVVVLSIRHEREAGYGTDDR
ncbi:hypothetical protein GCT13_38780 [Paraburkholderia sp. CNPSo 3157]|uniref:Type II toxin-antitoxin system RelE/ParE family toxin n=1 Tax=Paraburkholderia franconis TaxID=2654983 RepID=A0A7X1NIH7_9BURK|nr:type II toxin-antitoxin system RelE/ParE family toxin [Paraburkholderia franconis]MPW22608.1 hypothetical protein [Paraburkholderia franconis]